VSQTHSVACTSSFDNLFQAIRWNVEGTFFGIVETDIPLRPRGLEVDTRTLLFNTFIAAPLLKTTAPYKERSFTDMEHTTPVVTAGDTLAEFIQAYVHWTLVESGGSLLLADVQGEQRVISFT
jgi:hypothetical protein